MEKWSQVWCTAIFQDFVMKFGKGHQNIPNILNMCSLIRRSEYTKCYSDTLFLVNLLYL